MANIETQFLISKDIKNHIFFFKNLEPKATSVKQQASSNRQVGGWAHRQQASYPQVIHSSSYPQVIHRKNI